MYICTVKIAGSLLDPNTGKVKDILIIRANVDYNEKDYGRGVYAQVTIYDQYMYKKGEEILDWRYTRQTDTFKDLLSLFASTRWSGRNGSYRFEELTRSDFVLTQPNNAV